MFQPWRIQLREAQAALASGRLQAAGQLLLAPDLRRYAPAAGLLEQLAAALVRQGRHHLEQGHSTAGWRDLAAAEATQAQSLATAQLRHDLVAAALDEAVGYLAGGHLSAARRVLETLERRQPGQRAARQLGQLLELLEQVDQLSATGQLSLAAGTHQRAWDLRPDLEFLAVRQRQLQQACEEVRQRRTLLHRAVEQADWNAVEAHSARLLEISPRCPMAQAACRQAWQAVGAALPRQTKSDVQLASAPPRASPAGRIGAALDFRPHAEPSPGQGAVPGFKRGPRLGNQAPFARELLARELPMSHAPQADQRFMFWVDGVGGFLVCTAAELIVGQPAPGGRVDLPILADLSRQHATLVRSGEGCLIRAHRATRVDGRTVEAEQLATLVDGSLIQLGDAVKLRFRRPHPLSQTVRLELESHHRTRPAADAVLWMSDTLLLGPAGNAHVVAPAMTQQVALCRQGGQLEVRASHPLSVDGRPVSATAPLAERSLVVGDDFSFSLEPCRPGPT